MAFTPLSRIVKGITSGQTNQLTHQNALCYGQLVNPSDKPVKPCVSTPGLVPVPSVDDQLGFLITCQIQRYPLMNTMISWQDTVPSFILNPMLVGTLSWLFIRLCPNPH
jgi:hypothetical protein